MKVGSYKLTTASSVVISDEVECDEASYYANSTHPHNELNNIVKDVISKQQVLGDPVTAISKQYYWTDDTMGDNDNTGPQ